MFKQKILYTAFTFALCSSFAHASKINIVNENQKPIQVKITADHDNDAYMKVKISEKRESTFQVNREHLNGTSSFTIKGDTNPFTVGGKCANLDVEKDYKVTFSNDKVGTSCTSEIIANK